MQPHIWLMKTGFFGHLSKLGRFYFPHEIGVAWFAPSSQSREELSTTRKLEES